MCVKSMEKYVPVMPIVNYKKIINSSIADNKNIYHNSSKLVLLALSILINRREGATITVMSLIQRVYKLNRILKR
jgi:hypothetical protein